MSDDLNPIGKLALRYNSAPLTQSLTKLIPGGSTLDTLLQKRANEIKSDRLQVFFDELSIGEIALTTELIESETFLHSFFCTTQAVTQTRQQEKIRMFARLLRTSIAPNILTSTDECEELISTLDEISLREFAVLHALYRYEQKYVAPPPGDPGLATISMYWNNFLDEVTNEIELPAESIDAFMARLERTGLYLRITGAYFDYKGNRGRTTPLFARLLEFIETREA